MILKQEFLCFMALNIGVDVSSRVSTSSWQCLKSNGYHFAIVRVYQSNGKPDPNA